MSVEDIAREALLRGHVDPARRADFARGEAKALAIDAHDGIAAVLVVRRRRDDAWIIDVANFVERDDQWCDLGTGGGTWGDLPLDLDETAEPELGPVSSGWSAADHDGVATAGGFVVGRVAEVELAYGGRNRRVRLRPGSPAFVVTLAVRGSDDLDEMDVRAIDAQGNVLDSTAAWEAEREAALPGVTVEEALGVRDGITVTVRGLLLALPGEPPLLCDDVDYGPPPRCRGAALQIDAPTQLPATKVHDGGMSLVSVVMTGVIAGGALRLVAPPPASS